MVRAEPYWSRRQVFPLADVIRQAFSVVDHQLTRCGINCAIEVDDTLKCKGRPAALQQAFLNLILNSLEAHASTNATRKPNTIHVVATKCEKGNILKCEFWDQGPGISRAAFPAPDTIFHPGATSRPDKNGLGLTIGRQILRNEFGGDISLVRREGARFQITLPSHDRQDPKT
jgi:C4-dicarboxylate-specific signal transduction histidine kinase